MRKLLKNWCRLQIAQSAEQQGVGFLHLPLSVQYANFCMHTSVKGKKKRFHKRKKMQMTTTKITAEKSMSFIWINCVGASARLSLTLSVLEPLTGPFCGAEEYLWFLCEKEGGRKGSGEPKGWKGSFLLLPWLHSSCSSVGKEAWVWKGKSRSGRGF